MSERNTYRVLIVDDEEPARQRLRELMHDDPDVGEIIEAENGLDAVETILQKQPDIVFLDVQMPGLDGLDVIDTIGVERMPVTVFVTAFDQHAVRAFELAAIDYVLKPYGDERMEAAFSRAKARLDDKHVHEFGQNMLKLLDNRRPDKSFLDRIVIRERDKTDLIRVESIDCIESAGVYVALHVGRERVIHRAALGELVGRLDPRRFVRVHRSTVVNIDSILHLEPATHGEFDLILRGGHRVHVSRTFRPLLEARLGQAL
ncbi:LytR/AlgR family response regulator transcription factor [Dyella caseinilytica]|uniref:Response regulator transcription factor n=1 Tax=Dyella caseinilytica TaxID=1849581 RepID=A0ABX7GPI4_9GAMM|nr:LytTR family DNA-binding domain-containing protein [Dyella caseinilytica]QRN52266.1 response regulator transcription factor [Dyella caseinilytica]GGA14467.1 DNA-binding response regulator [Dyella caseinilytica]